MTFITKAGQMTFSQIPLDQPAKDSLNIDDYKFRNACRLLGSMVSENRIDAGLFLIGLLVYYKGNIKRLEVIVENLKYFINSSCANFLFDELINTESNNTNRIYLNSIIDILSFFPKEMVLERFYDLSVDKRFTYRMKNKFLIIIDKFENEDY
jgi:hypothetical protein